jgi:hypothetical protein
MKHLSRAEFVDLIESAPALPAERAQHVEQCERCRQEAATLCAMRLMVSDDETQEPSPLFWDHFSARVAEQLRREPVPAAERPWRPLPLVTWAAAATVVLLLISTVVWRTTLHAPAPHPSTDVSSPADLATVEPADDVDNDEAWAVVRAATADLGWEDARDAGISAHPGDVENAALQLNAAERVELERLLDEDMKRNGA